MTDANVVGWDVLCGVTGRAGGNRTLFCQFVVVDVSLVLAPLLRWSKDQKSAFSYHAIVLSSADAVEEVCTTERTN